MTWDESALRGPVHRPEDRWRGTRLLITEQKGPSSDEQTCCTRGVEGTSADEDVDVGDDVANAMPAATNKKRIAAAEERAARTSKERTRAAAEAAVEAQTSRKSDVCVLVL